MYKALSCAACIACNHECNSAGNQRAQRSAHVVAVELHHIALLADRGGNNSAYPRVVCACLCDIGVLWLKA